jgi:cytochrome P450 PksS
VHLASERYARDDVTIHGVRIGRGEFVHPMLASANRDERQFERPDELDITREPNRHLTFGLGVHYCLGAPLARIEGQIAINTLLGRMPNLRLAVPHDALRWRPGMGLHGLAALPVAFSRRRAPIREAVRSSGLSTRQPSRASTSSISPGRAG